MVLAEAYERTDFDREAATDEDIGVDDAEEREGDALIDEYENAEADDDDDDDDSPFFLFLACCLLPDAEEEDRGGEEGGTESIVCASWSSILSACSGSLTICLVYQVTRCPVFLLLKFACLC